MGHIGKAVYGRPDKQQSEQARRRRQHYKAPHHIARLFGFTPTQPGDNGKRWRIENDFNSRQQRQCGEKRSSDYRLCIEPTRQKKPKRSPPESRRHRVGAIRSEETTSELQSLIRKSKALF